MIADVLVKDVMTSPVFTLAKYDTLQTANDLFSKKGVHHIPVLDEGRLVGILSNADLERSKYGKSFFAKKKTAEYNDALLASTLIGAVMTHHVHTIGGDKSILEAYEIFKGNTYRCLPVLDLSVIVGIITPLDLLDHFFNQQ